MKWQSVGLVSLGLLLGFALGFLSHSLREEKKAPDKSGEIEKELSEIRTSMTELAKCSDKTVLAKCVNLPKVIDRVIEKQVHVTEAKETKPERKPTGVLRSALILAHPPENKSRILFYESYEKGNIDGNAMIIFHEFRENSFMDTYVEEAFVRWGATKNDK